MCSGTNGPVADAPDRRDGTADASSSSFSRCEDAKCGGRHGPSVLDGAEAATAPSISWLATHKPLALVTCVPEASVLFFAGAVAGAVGKTLTAPLDRLKLLMQCKGAMVAGALKDHAQAGNLLKAFVSIGRQEGIGGYWKGNVPQVLRVIPYSAAQLCSYEFFKKQLVTGEGDLPVTRKLAAGACAGMFSTLVTYPLDTLRLRLAMDPSLNSVPRAVVALMREGGPAAFFRGLGPAMIGIAPYMALELASYDTLPEVVPSFARGFTAALLATSCCYPLDTIRRQIQLQSARNLSMLTVIHDMFAKEGLAGFYRGFLPNAMKNLPNKGIRLTVFSTAKQLIQTAQDEKDAAKALWNESQPLAAAQPHVRRHSDMSRKHA